MQTLGVANSGPQSDGRLKSLFWPSIHTATDVDTLGSQGYWVCAIVAVVSLVATILIGQPVIAVLTLLYFYLGGVGVREHSQFAAAMVFVMYALNLVVSPGVISVLLSAILLANLRATYIASNWKPESEAAEMPMRFNDTWSDKFVDTFPRWLWPKIRIVYYIFSVGFLSLTLVGWAILMTRPHGLSHLR
jgi:hypothetical protein